MSVRHGDLMRQGFMKGLPSSSKAKNKTISDADWKASLRKAAQERYATYGPDFFKDEDETDAGLAVLTEKGGENHE